MLYQKIIKPLLFMLEPEAAHHLVLLLSSGISKSYLLLKITELVQRNLRHDPAQVFGLDFPNRLGLAAGFDKNCEAFEFMAALGFGHVEIGTVTNQPQYGNPKPRLWRLPEDEALINKLGFPSAGADVVAQRLKKIRARKQQAILGINLGKNKSTQIEDAFEDYRKLFIKLRELGDYYVINVSSPNTPELRMLQQAHRIEQLLAGIKAENILNKPILVKLTADLLGHELESTVNACINADVSGLIISNTTFSREGLTRTTTREGGLSGRPLFSNALQSVRRVTEISESRVPLIAVGGVSSRDEYQQMLEAGADLVQLYTAMVYQGPGLVRSVLAKP